MLPPFVWTVLVAVLQGRVERLAGIEHCHPAASNCAYIVWKQQEKYFSCKYSCVQSCNELGSLVQSRRVDVATRAAGFILEAGQQQV